MKKAMLYILGIIGLLVVGLIITLFFMSPGNPKQFLDKNGNKIKNSISEKVFLDINGSKQGMFIKSKNLDNPVILYLHGGLPVYFLTEKYPTHLQMPTLQLAEFQHCLIFLWSVLQIAAPVT